jgi:hypothetical protein
LPFKYTTCSATTGWISEDTDSIPITTASTPLPGLLVVGDSNFPGPGVGLCTLNQVDPYPITYSLSNP